MQSGYKMWILATHTDSTCQLVVWDSQGLVCLFLPLSLFLSLSPFSTVRLCVLIRVLHFLPLSPPHLSTCCSFLQHIPTLCLLRTRPSYLHPLDLFSPSLHLWLKNRLSQSLSASLLITSPRQPLHHRERPEISYKSTPVPCMNAVPRLSDSANSKPNNGISKAQSSDKSTWQLYLLIPVPDHDMGLISKWGKQWSVRKSENIDAATIWLWGIKYTKLI